MNYGNLPKSLPTVNAYRRSPLTLYEHFDVGLIPPEVTVALYSETGQALANEHLPVITALGQLVSIGWSKEQLAALPDYVKVEILHDGVPKETTRITPTLNPDYANQNPVLSDGIGYRISAWDTDVVRAAKQYADISAQGGAAAITATQQAAIATAQAIIAAQERGVAQDQADYAIQAKNEIVPLAAQISEDAGQVATDKPIIEGYKSDALTSRNQAEVFRDQTLDLVTMIQQGIFEGDWNAATNTPALTATPNAARPDGINYIVTTAGVTTFAGTNFAVGQAMSIGDSLWKKGSQWVRIPKSDLALANANWQNAELERLSLQSAFSARRRLAAPLTLARLSSTDTVTTGASNSTQTANVDRTVSIKGHTDTTSSGEVSYWDTGIAVTGNKKIVFEAQASAFVTANPQMGIGFLVGTDRVGYLYRVDGTLSRVLNGTSSTIVSAADPAKAFVVGDIIRVEYHLSGVSTTLKYFRNGIQKGTDYVLPDTPTGNIRIVMRGSADFTYTLTTELPNANTAAIDAAKTEAKQFTKDYTQALYSEYHIFSRLIGTGSLPLNTTYILDAIGDYVEIVIKWAGAVFQDGMGLIGTPPGGNENSVGFYSDTLFYVRGNDASDAYAIWTYPAGWSADFRTIRLEVVAGGWKLSVDGVSLGTQAKLRQLNINNIGGAYSTKVKGDIKSVRIHNATQDLSIGLLGDVAGAVNAPTVYEKKAIAGAATAGLNDVYFEYNPTGYGGQPRFYVYTRYGSTSDYYARHEVVRYFDNSIRADCYRIVGAALYRMVSGAMAAQGRNLLTNGESESVYQQTGKSDFAGGFHGDEKYTEIKFFVNGIVIQASDLTNAIELTGADEFYYVQKSNVYEVDNVVDVIHALHTKKTAFLLSKYDTFNRYAWQAAINVATWYAGIACVTHDQAGKVFAEDYNEITTNTTTGNIYLTAGLRELNYYNAANRLGLVVTSQALKPAAYDAGAIIRLWDNATYAKYYRGVSNKTTSIGEVWESKQEVRYFRR